MSDNDVTPRPTDPDAVWREHTRQLGGRVKSLHDKTNMLAGRIDALERADIGQRHDIVAINGRLQQGAETMNELKMEDVKLHDAITPPSPWRLLLALAPGLVFVGLLIWGASRYPNNEDVKAMITESTPYARDKARIMRVVDGYETTIPGIQLKLGIIDAKLDLLLKKLEDDENRPRRRNHR